MELIGERNYRTETLQNGVLGSEAELRAASKVFSVFTFCDAVTQQLQLGGIPFLFPLVPFPLKVFHHQVELLDKSFHIL